MSWQLNHCFVGAPCNSGTPLVAMPTTLLQRIGRRRSRATCEKDLGLGIGESLRHQIDGLLASRGFPSDASSGESPWLWCLGGHEVYRQRLSEEDQLDLQPDACVDLNLYVCETHQTVAAQLDHIDAVPEWGGSGPDDPRQSDPIPLGSTSQVADVAMELISKWLDHEIISRREARSDHDKTGRQDQN